MLTIVDKKREQILVERELKSYKEAMDIVLYMLTI